MTTPAADVSAAIQSILDNQLGGAASEVLIENLNKTNLAAARGASPDDLVTDTATLVCFVIDDTGSMAFNRQVVIEEYNRMLAELKKSKAADTVLLSTILFNTKSKLLHGYLPLDKAPELTAKDYDPEYETALFDAVLDAFTGVANYGQELRNNGFNTKIVIVVITDGEDNKSRHTSTEVKTVAEEFLGQEIYTLAMVAFGRGFAQSVCHEMGFPNLLEVNADGSSIRRALGTTSASVIRASQTTIGAQPSHNFFS